MKNLNLHETIKISGGHCTCYKISDSYLEKSFAMLGITDQTSEFEAIRLMQSSMQRLQQQNIKSELVSIESYAENCGITDKNTCKVFCCFNSPKTVKPVGYKSSIDNVITNCP